MSKILVLSDSTELEFTDTSTLYSLKMVLTSFTQIDSIWENFTVSNMASCTFDGESYTDIIPVSVSATASLGDNITLTITTRETTSEEIIAKQAEQIAELQEAIAELG